MTPVWRLLRQDLQSRWRALLALALLLGLVGGALLACADGARRTDTAYDRLRAWAHASQVQVIADRPGNHYRQLAKLPDVASVAATDFIDAMLPGGRLNSVVVMSSADNSYGMRTDKVKILAGRMWDPSDPAAVLIDQQLAAAQGLGPGSTLRLDIVPQDKSGSSEPAKAVQLRLRVAAVVVFDNQVAPATANNDEPEVLLSPRFAQSMTNSSSLAARSSFGTELSVQLRPGATVAGFVTAADKLAGAQAGSAEGNFDVVDLTDQIHASQQAIRPQAIALAAFALLAALILLAVAGQLLSRQLVLDSADFPVLRALGVTPSQLLTMSLVRLACVTLTAGLMAVVVAVLSSPLTPIGPARLAEPRPGMEVNVAILGSGLALIMLMPLILVLPTAWRTAARPADSARAGERRAPRQPSALMTALSTSGSVTRGLGMRMAFQSGHGRSAVPVRSALLGTIVAIAATVASIAFSASFVHLLGTPSQYGQNWQRGLDLGFGGVPAPLVTRIAAIQPGLQGYAAGNYGEINVNGMVVPAIGIDSFRGSGFVTTLSGRAPVAANEIAFGAQTMRELHLRLGEWVRIRLAGQQQQGPRRGRQTLRMKIVGTSVLPAFGQGSIIATDLGSGAVVPAKLLSVAFPQTGCTGNVTCYNFILDRYRPGMSLRAATAQLVATTKKIGCPPGACQVTGDQKPTDIRNYARIRQTPLILGSVLALLAISTLAHVLLSSVRRRARDLAILKVLGLGRKQILSVVLWQAVAVSLAALLVGLPVGVLAGRWAWALFAGSAGVPVDPVVSVPALLALIPVALVLGGLVAAIPGLTAARVRPGAVLRAE